VRDRRRAARRPLPPPCLPSPSATQRAVSHPTPRFRSLARSLAPPGDYGYAALHWAARLGHAEVAAALLDGKYSGRGASVFLRSFTAKTPLMLAARDGNEGVARLLLARGANPASQDAEGRTAHDLADPGPVRRLLAEAEAALRR
jgi:hypothetical protein